MKPNVDLFKPLYPINQLHPSFQWIMSAPGHQPTRDVMQRVFDTFHDVDGNFVEQLQTTGFDARIWELYLFAVWTNHGFTHDRTHERPDYLLERAGVAFGVEAVTSNPPQGSQPQVRGEGLKSIADVLEYQRNIMPIRLGSSLFSKLKKKMKQKKGEMEMKYWELPQMKDKPLVFAIEAFHDADSLGFSDSALITYLYGLNHHPTWDERGNLVVQQTQVTRHKHKEKDIPSGFFNQPDAENASAVIFSNSGTIAKFQRMGYASGVYPQIATMRRAGCCYDWTPNAHAPAWFHYEVGDPDYPETWGQGLTIHHNPRAKIPLDMDVFDGFYQGWINKDCQYVSEVPDFHPFASKTVCLVPRPDDEVRTSVK